MSRKARAATKERRLRAKRARRAAQKTQYEEWKLRGQNKKSKRARKHAKGQNALDKVRLIAQVPTLICGIWALAPRLVHSGPMCGNFGCKRCSNYWNKKKTEIILLGEIFNDSTTK